MTRRPTDGLVRELLPNGITLLVQRRTTVRAASLVAHVRAGFLDEPDELVGVSHVLEHMLFKGTPSLGPGELAQRARALGGALNAYTSYDRTVYYMSAPSRSLTEIIALQADQVRNSTIDAEELRRELGVIIQEARRKLDSPGAVAGEMLHELLYQQHRIRRWRIGQEARLETLTRDEVLGYYRRRYVPSRVIISLVSDLPEHEALARLRAAWRDWQAPYQPPEPGPAEASNAVARARRMSGDVTLTQLVIGWRAPGILAPELPALETAATILGGGRGARLVRRLRETGVVNDVGTSIYGVTDAGVFVIGVELDAARIPEALDAIAADAHALADEGPVPAELERARTLLRARITRRLERYESRAIALADAEAHGDVTRLDREAARIAAVTNGDVRRVVRDTLRDGEMSAVAYLPGASAEPFDEATLASAFARVTRPTPLAVPDNVSRAPTAIIRTSRDADGAVRRLTIGSLDVLTARFGESGQTSINVYHRRHDIEGPDNAGIAVLTARSLLRGTRDRDAASLAFAIESLGGSLSPSAGPELFGVGANVLSESVSEAAALLAEVLFAPALPVDSIEIERGQLLDDARATADDMVRFPMQLALGAAFNDVGYGSPALGTRDSLARLDAATVHAWHDALLSSGRTTVIAVGDTDAEQLAEQVGAALEPWLRNGGAPSPTVTTPIAIAPGHRSVTRDRQQSALAMLFPGPSRRDAQRFAAETWSAVAGGLGGRLFESLRSARSLAYTVMASSWQRRRAGGLLTYIAMAPSRLDEARDAMLGELAQFRAEPPSDEEMTRATASLIGEIELARQTVGAFAGEIADAWFLGDGLHELDDPSAPYRLVTAADVHAVAAQSLDPSSRAEGVVIAEGPE